MTKAAIPSLFTDYRRLLLLYNHRESKNNVISYCKNQLCLTKRTNRFILLSQPYTIPVDYLSLYILQKSTLSQRYLLCDSYIFIIVVRIRCEMNEYNASYTEHITGSAHTRSVPLQPYLQTIFSWAWYRNYSKPLASWLIKSTYYVSCCG